MPEIARVCRPYYEWEDYAAGLYRMPADSREEITAQALLAAPALLLAAMRDAVVAWPLAAEHQLSNTEQNRQAWLGWAACHRRTGANALSTRAAWSRLTDAQRRAANVCANTVISEWEAAHGGGSYQGTLFDFDGGLSGA